MKKYVEKHVGRIPNIDAYETYRRYWRHIRPYELGLRNNLRKACSYMSSSGRWDIMFASISHDTLKAFREGAKNSVWLHRTARGLSALFFAEILYDEFDEIIQAMEEAGDIACDIPLSQVRQWLQHAEDLCRESRVVYELIAK